jgi:transcriptional regulator with XRE-family HTH domain
MSLSKKLRQLREDRSLTILQCAKAVGVSPSTYRDWEYGRSISGEPYLKIAEVLGVSLSELLGSQPHKNLHELEMLETTLVDTLHRVRRLKAVL